MDSTSIDEDAGTATVWVNRRFGSSLTTTVRVTSIAGTATANVDYTDVDEIVTWEGGDAARKPVVVSITDELEWGREPRPCSSNSLRSRALAFGYQIDSHDLHRG